MFKVDKNNKNLHYLEDDKGNRRIQIGLDENGNPFLEFLKEDGTIQWQASNKDDKQPVKNLNKDMGEVSDGYHTFNELYEFRKMYNAALFNEWAKQPKFASAGEGVRGIISIPKQPIKYNVHKSWKHHNGEECFGGGWFIVSAMLPTGLISNHYKAEDWDLFKVPETEKALFEFDGHTGKDVLERLKNL